MAESVWLVQVLGQQSGKTNDVWLKECRSTFATMISHKADREASEAQTQVLRLAFKPDISCR